MHCLTESLAFCCRHFGKSDQCLTENATTVMSPTCRYATRRNCRKSRALLVSNDAAVRSATMRRCVRKACGKYTVNIRQSFRHFERHRALVNPQEIRLHGRCLSVRCAAIFRQRRASSCHCAAARCAERTAVVFPVVLPKDVPKLNGAVNGAGRRVCAGNVAEPM